MATEDKKTQLSIVLRTVDEATAKIKAINERLDEATKPVRDFKKQLSELAEKSGLNTVAEGFHKVGENVKETLFKLLEIGVVIGETVHLVFELVEHFEQLGKTAERLGVSADFLAEMRYAAEKTGIPVEKLDQSLLAFNENLGALRANTGRMKKFLDLVSPALERQLKGAKSNAEAFDILAGAMAKIEDPAKRAALAQKTLGDSSLAPLFKQGPKGIKELRERYMQLAGSQEGAVEASEETKSALVDLHASMDGVKAAIVEGLAPALTVIVKQLQEWFVAHRGDIKEWAESLGERIPGAFHAVVGAISTAIDFIRPFVDEAWKLKLIAGALAATIVGPLIASVVRFGIVLATTPIGVFLLQLAAVAAATYAVVKAMKAAASFGRRLGEGLAFRKLTNQYEEQIRDLNKEAIDAGEMSNAQVKEQAESRAASDLAAQHGQEDAEDKHAEDAIAAAEQRDQLSNASPAENIKAALANSPLAQNIAQALVAALGSSGDAKDKEAKITVSFANAPRGTRVSTDPQNTAGVDLNVGYQMIGATP